MTAANGYECLACGEVERDDKGRPDVECGRCGDTNTVARRITDCDLEDCADDTHDYGASWHVEDPKR
jgi:DNA-directed RNA polymerase subunit RPC12/RpoP